MSGHIDALVASWTSTNIESLSIADGVGVNKISASNMQILDFSQNGFFLPTQISHFQADTIGACPAATITGFDTSCISQFTQPQIAAFNSIENPSKLAIKYGDDTDIVSTGDQIAALSASPAFLLSYFDASQMSWMSPEQFKSITPGQMSRFTNVQMAGFTPACIRVLSIEQFKALVQGQFTGLGTNLITDISAGFWSDLSSTQVEYITPGQYGALLPGQVEKLPTSVGVMSHFDASQIHGFTPTQMQSMSPGTFVAFSAAQINYMDASQIVQLDTSCVSLLIASTIAQLSDVVTGALTQPQIRVLTYSGLAGDQTRALNVNYLLNGHILYLSDAQLADLSDTQIQALSRTQIGELSTANRLDELTPQQIHLLTATASPNDQFQGIVAAQMSEFDVSQVEQFTSACIEVLSPAQFKKLGSNQFIGLGTSLITHIPDAVWADLSSTQVGYISPAQIHVLTPEQVEKLPTSVGVMSHFDASQIAQFAPLSLVKMTPNTFNAFSAAQINFMDASQIVQLDPSCIQILDSTKIAALNEVVTRALTYAQLNSLSHTGLAGDQTRALNASYLSADQIARLLPPERLQDLTPTQVGLFKSVQLTDISGGPLQNLNISQLSPDASATPQFPLPYDHVDDLTSPQVKTLGSTLLGVLDASQINQIPMAYFDPSQIPHIAPLVVAALDEAHIDALVELQMKAFTEGQIERLTGEQLQFLSSTQMGYFKDTQIPWFTSSEPSGNSAYGGAEGGQIVGFGNNIIDLPQGQFSYFTPNQTSAFKNSTTQTAYFQAQNSSKYAAVLLNLAGSYGLLKDDGSTGSIAAIQELLSSQIPNLSGKQMGFLSKDQIVAFLISDSKSDLSSDGNDAMAMNILNYTSTQIKAISVDSSVDASGNEKYPIVYQLKVLDDSLAVEFTATQIQAFGPTQISTFITYHANVMTAPQFQALTGLQVAAIDPELFKTIANVDFAFPFTDASYITTDQALKMTRGQFQQLSGATLHNMTAAAFHNVDASGAFDASFVQAAYINDLQAAQMTHAMVLQLSTDSIAALQPSVLRILTDAVGIFPASSITAQQSAVMTSFQLHELSTTSVHNLQVECFGKFTTTTVAGVTTTTRVSGFSVDQVSGFTEAQVNVMSTDQLNALTPEAKAQIISIQVGSIRAIDINIVAFETGIDAPLFESNKIPAVDLSACDATIEVTMPIANARDMFKYSEGSDGFVHLYLDRAQFKISYTYSDSSHLDVIADDFTTLLQPSVTLTPAEVVRGLHTYTYGVAGGLQWDGPVIANSVSSDTNIPATWDYIHHTAQCSFNNFAAFSLYNNLFTQEKTLRGTLNTDINSTIDTILGKYDKTSAGNARILDPKNGNIYYTKLIKDSTLDNTNIMSLVFNKLYSNQPQRFINASLNEDQITSYPFFSGDTLNFRVVISPDQQQYVLASNHGTAQPAIIKERSYKMRIVIR